MPFPLLIISIYETIRSDDPNAFEVVPVLVRGGGVDKHLQNSKTFSILDAVPSVCFGFDVLSASSDI